ncbi:hypothetical protein JCM3770_002081 [Rhodotorula araucariae]
MSAKRSASSAFATSNAPPAKRAAPSTLAAYFPSLTGPAQPPAPLVASDPVTDRASTFVAHAAPCTNRVQAQTLQAHVGALRNKDHPVECSHEILAWRCMALRPGRTGVDSEDDWRAEGGADDDGEKGAGAVVREVLEKEGGVDCAIVVSRLYGGIMLGPARFSHIRTVASQALARLLAAQRLAALAAQLATLDSAIAALSPASASASSPPKLPPAQTQYAALTVDKAERLVAAREKRLGLLEKKRREEEEALWRAVEGEGEGEGEDEGEDKGGEDERGPPLPAGVVGTEVTEEAEEGGAQMGATVTAEVGAAAAAEQEVEPAGKRRGIAGKQEEDAEANEAV